MEVKSTDNNSLFSDTGIDNSDLKSGISDAQGLASKISKINSYALLAVGALWIHYSKLTPLRGNQNGYKNNCRSV